MQEDKKSALERLEKNLYSRNDPGLPRRHLVHGENTGDVETSWHQDETKRSDFTPTPKMPLHTMVFIASGLFFLIAAGIAAYSFFGGSQTVSVDNIDISIEGPVSIGGGETLDLAVSVQNKNSTSIDSVNLTTEFPDGTKDPVDASKDLTRATESVGSMQAGGVSERQVRAVVFGGENEKKLIKVAVEYRTAGSNAIFRKEKTYEVTISSSPVTVSIEGLTKVSSGKDVELSVSVTSNSTTILRNMALAMDYPFGFSFKSALPAPVASNSLFSIGDLAPGTKRTFVIKGTVTGEDGETRVFHARAGVRGAETDNDIATTIVSQEYDIAIEKPFIGIDMVLDSVSTGDIATYSGKPIRVDIAWTNNLPTRVINAVLTVKLSGNAIDKNSVAANRGFYNSLENTISWDSRQVSDFQSLAPGATGHISFSVSTLRRDPSSPAGNSSVSISATAVGSRIDDVGSTSNVSSTVNRTIRVNTEANISSATIYSTGEIKNTGPIPPRAEKETTYTIVWTVSNSSNSISHAEVRATLPPYVTWKNTVLPDQNVTYNPVGGVIVWNVGSVGGGTGYGRPPTSVSFQVGFTPSVSQVGSKPELVSPPELTATDDFTGSVINARGDSATTHLSDNPLNGDIVTN